MTDLPYDEFNDLVHEIADLIEKATDLRLDRVELNDLLSSYLSSKDVAFVDD